MFFFAGLGKEAGKNGVLPRVKFGFAERINPQISVLNVMPLCSSLIKGLSEAFPTG